MHTLESDRETKESTRMSTPTKARPAFGTVLAVKILEDSAKRGRVDWTAYYTFKATGRPVVNRIHTEMAISSGKIVRQVDTFSLWRWSRQALGTGGLLLGWTPIVRNKVRAQAAQSLREFGRKAAGNQEIQETR